ncbi:MAG: fluoride efflux transporter CrcB [Hyphomicrobiales bacterium]
MPTVIWVALGGAIGASARYLVGVQALRLMGPGFPWGTLSVNIAGSFLMGMLIELLAMKINLPQDVRHFLTTGVLGGFTTFSAFSLDFAILTERKAHLLAWSYMGASVAGSILALFAGLWLIRMVLQ